MSKTYALDEKSRNPVMDYLVMLLNDQEGTNYCYEEVHEVKEETA